MVATLISDFDAKNPGADVRICVYAFSTSALFFRSLIESSIAAGDKVEWSVICPQGHFRHLFADIIPPERRYYLYDDFNTVYARCNEVDIQRALECGDGLIPSLMRDKEGFRLLGKDEQLKRAAVIHDCYRAFLKRVKPDHVLFPIPEVVDGFVLMNLCRAMGIGILSYTSMRFLGRSCFSTDHLETLPSYYGGYTNEDLDEARAALRRFRERRASYVPGVGYSPAPPPKPSLFRRLIVSEYLRWGPERLHATEDTWIERLKRNSGSLRGTVQRWWFKISASRYFDAIEHDKLPERYVFYALHFTPESSVNGLAPYYVDQLRAIDQLLLSLPAGYRLVVKEHPTMYGRRPIAFYRELSRHPGLILLSPKLDSRRLIEGSMLVATVTGTVGLEAFLLGKPCLAFGPNFFAHLCHRAPPVSCLRPVLEEIIANYRPATETEKEIEIAKMLNVGGNFLIYEPWLQPTMMAPGNVAATREYLWRHLARLRSEQTVPQLSNELG